MTTQVEVQSGDVGRTVTGGRPHLCPLTDSSNTNPSITQSHIITPEPQKPVPAPKPRMTPKPYAVEKKNTIKPILAPKPQTKPRPEFTSTTGYKPELPNSSKPQQPVAIVKPRPVSPSSSRPASTSFRTSTMVNAGQTTKPVVHPFKPTPTFDSLYTSKDMLPLPAERQKPKNQMIPMQGGASIARAKSLGFLNQIEKDDEQNKSLTVVPPKPQPRGSRPRPVSAVFLNKPEIPVPAPRVAGGKPLSSDLTSKFESIGLSLHHRKATNVKESTPKENALPQKTQQEKISTLNQNNGIKDKHSASDEQNNDISEKISDQQANADQRFSIKSRISLLLDSPSTPETVFSGPTSDILSPEQAMLVESEPQVGVKELIKQLTEDISSTQNPVMKPAPKPRDLPTDRTKKFPSEKLSDSCNVSFSGTAENQDTSKDPQTRIEVVNPSGKMTVEFQDHLKKINSMTSIEAEPLSKAINTQSGPSVEVQTIQASLFDNSGNNCNLANVIDLLSNPSLREGNNEDEGSLVTAIYKDSVSPSPLRVNHALDIVQAVGENKAVSEDIPSAQREEKAMTLRSRRSEVNRPMPETSELIKGGTASTMAAEQQPRYLRIGSLQKWPTKEVAQEDGLENVFLKQSQREMDLNNDKERQRDTDHEEIAAAPKRMKTLQINEKPKPKETYFALTGQIQEADTRSDIIDSAVPDDDVGSGQVSSQSEVSTMKWNLSLNTTGKKSQEKYENVKSISHIQAKQVTTKLDVPIVEKKKVVKTEQTKEGENQHGKMKVIDRDKQRQMEIERQAIFQFSQMKEREMQRQFERRKAFDRENQKQRELPNQNLQGLEYENLTEMDKQRLLHFKPEKDQQQEQEIQRRQEVERQKELQRQRELEKQRQQEIHRQKEQEKERQAKLQRQREQELERQQSLARHKEQEMERQLEQMRMQKQENEQQRELERQELTRLREQEVVRHKEEVSLKEKKRQEELGRVREQEKEQQKELERQREMERQQEIMRLKEQERERQRQFERQQELMRLREQEVEQQGVFERQQEMMKQREQEGKRLQEQMTLREQEIMRLKELERQQEQLRHREQERERQREVERQHTQMKLRERGKERHQEQLRLREQEVERQQELEKHKDHVKERQRELEMQQEQLKQREQEIDRQRDLEQQQEKVRLRERQLERQQELKRQQERLRHREQEMEGQELQQQQEQVRMMEAEMERLSEIGRQQREQDMERQREFEQQQGEVRLKEQEMERRRELKRQLERLRQREQEMERQHEIEQQHEQVRLRDQEMERQRELERQQQQLRQREQEIERERQLVQQQEKVRLKEQEMERQRELERQQQLRQREQEIEREEELARQQERVRLKEQEMERLQQFERQQEQLRHREQEKERLQEAHLQQEQVWLREQEKERQWELHKQQELDQGRQREWERHRQREEHRQLKLDKESLLLEMQKNKRMVELERVKEKNEGQFFDQNQKQKDNERYHLYELEKQWHREKVEKTKLMALEQELVHQKGIDKKLAKQRQLEEEEIEREKIKELGRLRDLQREKHVQAERQSQRLIQQSSLNERLRWEAEKDKSEMAEAEKMRQIARLQEAERHRLKDKKRKEELERMRVDQSSLKPKVVDVDSLLRTTTLQHIDSALRWKEPSPRAEEPYKPSILDVDSFTSHSQPSSNQNPLPVSSIQEVDPNLGSVLQTAPEREITWKIPSQNSVHLANFVRTVFTHGPRDLQRNEMSHNKPQYEPRKHTTKVCPEQLSFRQDKHSLASQSHWPVKRGEPLYLDTSVQNEARTNVPNSGPVDQVWLPRQLKSHKNQEETWNHRRSQGSQELNRMRSRSMSRRSAPSGVALEKGLSRVRSRSAHREQDNHSGEQQKQTISGEDERKGSKTPVGETDSQYGTWETGLCTDESLTPATPSSESNLSPSPRNTTPSHPQGEHDSFDGRHPPSKSENQPLLFPDAPITLLDTGVQRSRVQLGKKRAPRTRPSRAARQNSTQVGEQEATTEDWLYRDSTEEKVERKLDEVDCEEPARGADTTATFASQPQRIALFPGVDSQALKVQLKKRSDSDNQTDAPPPSLLCRSPKSPFLPRAARVLPPSGGKENGEEESPQWLKELKSKKRLSQYENES